MKNSIPNKPVWIILTVLVMMGIIVSGVALGSPLPPKTESMSNPSKVWIVAGEPSDITVKNPPPVEFLNDAPQTANISVNYVGAWDAQAQAAFEYAVSIWETQITSSVPIVINAEWANLGAGILGGAGAENLFRDFSGAPVANTWYPVALANKIAGTDLDPGGVDIGAAFNSGFSSWYFGTDGNTPSNKWDFASVVLHEIGHGLGFFGSMTVGTIQNGDCGGVGIGCWGFDTNYPAIYDLFTQNSSGTPLLGFPNYSSELAAQLTSGGVYFNGPNANPANGNARVPLYAPGSWQQGSSYSHLAESFNGTANALMTYSLGPGEVQHAPGPVMLAMFTDMGWSISAPTPTPTKTLTPTPKPTCTPVPTVTPIPMAEGSSSIYVPVISKGVPNCYPYSGGSSPTATPSATPPSGWTTLLSENFEGTFPGTWELWSYYEDYNYIWGKRNCQAYGGSYGAWAIGGGTLGQGLGCGANYTDNLDVYMFSGQLSLASATDAELTIKGWLNSEAVYDMVCLLASPDNVLFGYSCWTGSAQSWQDYTLDLSAVPELGNGNLLGDSSVWIAIEFYSDSSINTPHGVYVDNLVVRKCTTGSCVLSAPADYPGMNVTTGVKELNR